MKKILILIVSLVLFLSGCSRTALHTDTVYVCSSEGSSGEAGSLEQVKYNIGKYVYNFPETYSEKKANVAMKTFSFLNRNLQLEYEKTYSQEFIEGNIDSYTDLNSSASVGFFENTDKLASVRLRDLDINLATGTLQEEADYIRICEDLVSAYIDCSEYTVSCETIARVIDENGLNTFKYDSFVNPDTFDLNSDVTYTFRYIRYMDGYLTSDGLLVELTKDGFLKRMSLANLNEAFDRFQEISIDKNKCESLIRDKITSMCDINGYDLESHNDTNVLIIINGQLCLLTFVKPSVKNIATGKSVSAEEILLLIPLT